MRVPGWSFANWGVSRWSRAGKRYAVIDGGLLKIRGEQVLLAKGDQVLDAGLPGPFAGKFDQIALDFNAHATAAEFFGGFDQMRPSPLPRS